ncbi:MAG: tetratricopeptide repeat protein [Cyanobacteria bacterium HKST-UBA02]|nr:tetratricopeptide repeat protein [Cyanobacteria bacterium HKST-UBA02]
MTRFSRRLASAAICLALATLTSSCTKPVGSDAEDLIKAGKYKEAIELCKRELEEHPKDSFLYASKAYAEYSLKQFEQARDDYLRAIELDKTVPWYHVELGTTYSRLDENDKALAAYDAALALDNQGSRAALTRAYKAYIYLSEYNHKRALAESDAAISIDPKLAQAYVARAAARTELMDFDNALKDADKAIELDSKSERAYVARSSAYYRKYEFEKAAEAARKALEIKPGDFMATEFLAASYEGLGDTDKALELMDKLMEKYPDNSQLTAGKAYVLLTAARIEEAREYADRAIAMKNIDPSALMVAGTLAAMKGDRERAMDLLDKCEKRIPEAADVERSRAIALIALKDYEGAIKAADAALVKMPGTASAYRIKSEAERRLGLDSEAERDLKKALDLHYRRPSQLDSLFKLL